MESTHLNSPEVSQLATNINCFCPLEVYVVLYGAMEPTLLEGGFWG